MKILLITLPVLLVACNSIEKYQKKSVGQTGCAWTEIEISEVEDYRWIATCEGKQYRCNDSGVKPVCKIITDN